MGGDEQMKKSLGINKKREKEKRVEKSRKPQSHEKRGVCGGVGGRVVCWASGMS